MVPQGHVFIGSVLGVSAESHLVEVGLCLFLANASSFFGQACLGRHMRVSCYPFCASLTVIYFQNIILFINENPIKRRQEKLVRDFALVE